MTYDVAISALNIFELYQHINTESNAMLTAGLILTIYIILFIAAHAKDSTSGVIAVHFIVAFISLLAFLLELIGWKLVGIFMALFAFGLVIVGLFRR